MDIDKKEIISRIEEIKEKNDENFYKEKIGALREKVNAHKETENKLKKEKEELKDKIKKKREKVIAALKEEREKILKNKDKSKKLTMEEIRKLVAERKKLNREIRTKEHLNLVHTPKWKQKDMSDEEKEQIKQARQKSKDNRKRIDEINEKLEISSFFDGKTPEELLEKNKIVMENIEKYFNFDKIEKITSVDKITSKIYKKDKEQIDDRKKTEVQAQQQISNQEKEEVQPEQQTSNQEKVQVQSEQQTSKQETAEAQTQQPVQAQQQLQSQLQQVVQPYQNNLYNTEENIAIFEAEGIALYNFGNQQGIVNLKRGKEAKKEKREMYKRLNLKKRVKGFGTLRKVNPAIIKILEQIENGDKMIDQYLQSIKSKNQFNFQLKHDFVGLNIFQKFKMNRQAKHERKCGANVVGKLFGKNDKQIYAIDEPQTANVNTLPRARTMDSYVRADEETIHRTEQVGQRAGMEQENQEVANENIYSREDVIK